jgi:hypothetical protein
MGPYPALWRYRARICRASRRSPPPAFRVARLGAARRYPILYVIRRLLGKHEAPGRIGSNSVRSAMKGMRLVRRPTAELRGRGTPTPGVVRTVDEHVRTDAEPIELRNPWNKLTRPRSRVLSPGQVRMRPAEPAIAATRWRIFGRWRSVKRTPLNGRAERRILVVQRCALPSGNDDARHHALALNRKTVKATAGQVDPPRVTVEGAIALIRVFGNSVCLDSPNAGYPPSTIQDVQGSAITQHAFQQPLFLYAFLHIAYFVSWRLKSRVSVTCG